MLLTDQIVVSVYSRPRLAMAQWYLSKMQWFILLEAFIIVLYCGTYTLTPLRNLIAVDSTVSVIQKVKDLDSASLVREASPRLIPLGRKTDSVAAESPEDLRHSWKKGGFCHSFIVDTFNGVIPMCGAEMRNEDQVICYGNTYSNAMALCSFQNLSLRPQQMKTVLPNDINWEEPINKTINLLQSNQVDCKSPTSELLFVKAQEKDYEVKLTHHLISSEKLLPQVCDTWINKTAFFHISNSHHIYFRFLDLYNVHKTLLDYGSADGDSLVIRIGNFEPEYMFPDFDKVLFPGALTLEDLENNGTVCFKRVFLVPRSYQAIPFRCKMNPLLSSHCFECSGVGINSPLQTFRNRVLKACRITDSKTDHFNILVVSRTPYERWSGDQSTNFHRVLVNENEMVIKIRESFPKVNVKVMHLEKLDICEQVKHAVEADVMLGVHGAGLVHFWWLRDDAVALELEPTFERSNPSFRMLTTLTGKNYTSEIISGNSSLVTVDIDQLMGKLKSLMQIS